MKFWGVQGSIPAPNSPDEIEKKIAKALVKVHEKGGLEEVLKGKDINVENVRKEYLFNEPAADKTVYGRETTCAEIRTSDGKLIVVDAGSGLRKLGYSLMKELPLDATMLITHTHWDHIQGFPFFTPAYIPGNKVKIYGVTKSDKRLEDTLKQNLYPGLRKCFKTQMSNGFFPVKLNDLASKVDFYKMNGKPVKVGNADITAMLVNHPDPTLAYRIDDNGKSLVVATDHEHYIKEENVDHSNFPNFREESHSQLEKFAKNADVLVYDGQYTPEEYNPQAYGKEGMSKIGWGHSTYKHGIDLAIKAGVKKLVLTHHEPTHNDNKCDEIKYTARKYLFEKIEKEQLPKDCLNVVLAYEGMELEV